MTDSNEYACQPTHAGPTCPDRQPNPVPATPLTPTSTIPSTTTTPTPTDTCQVFEQAAGRRRAERC